MYQLSIQNQTITIQGTTYTPEDISLISRENLSSFEVTLFSFLDEWFTSSPFITVHTSGSTGTPKKLTVKKEQMMQSARMTCSFLNLTKGDNVLLCMPLSYIAGKMIVVRALVAGLNLYPVSPSGHPLADTNTVFQFAAMIPLQVFNSLQIPEEKERLEKIEKLIIGGGVVDTLLEKELKNLPHEIYSTYGMTETLSHIAMRKLNGQDASLLYTPLPSVTLSLSPDETLVIHAPLVNDKQLTTNDVARILPDGRFAILGRKDNIINSGGIKIQAEEIENLLRRIIGTAYAITSRPDAKFGEVVVLLVESQTDHHQLMEDMRKILTPYQLPKLIITVEAIPLTDSGKINRAKVKEIASGQNVQL